MEQTWIFYALAGMISLGLGDFIKKLVVNKQADKDVFLLLCFLFYVPMLWLNYLFRGTGVFSPELIKTAIIVGCANLLIPLGILTSLKYVNVSFGLVSIRIISSFILLYIGIYVIGDVLSIYNIIGFSLGIVAIFLLSGFKIGEENNIHWKGVVAMILSIIGIVVSNAYFKYAVEGLSINDYMPLQFSITLSLLVIYMLLRNKFKLVKIKEIKIVFWHAAISGVLFVVYFLYLLPNIYLLGPLSLGYKMLSYSLVVPIILSVIFLGEPINKTRIIAFGLTIISIFLFLV